MTKKKTPVAHGCHEFATAMRQIVAAANNLSKVSEGNGSIQSLRASALLMQLRHALEYGACYPTAAHAAAFDKMLCP